MALFEKPEVWLLKLVDFEKVVLRDLRDREAGLDAFERTQRALGAFDRACRGSFEALLDLVPGASLLTAWNDVRKRAAAFAASSLAIGLAHDPDLDESPEAILPLAKALAWSLRPDEAAKLPLRASEKEARQAALRVLGMLSGELLKVAALAGLGAAAGAVPMVGPLLKRAANFLRRRLAKGLDPFRVESLERLAEDYRALFPEVDPPAAEIGTDASPPSTPPTGSRRIEAEAALAFLRAKSEGLDLSKRKDRLEAWRLHGGAMASLSRIYGVPARTPSPTEVQADLRANATEVHRHGRKPLPMPGPRELALALRRLDLLHPGPGEALVRKERAKRILVLLSGAAFLLLLLLALDPRVPVEKPWNDETIRAWEETTFPMERRLAEEIEALETVRRDGWMDERREADRLETLRREASERTFWSRLFGTDEVGKALRQAEKRRKSVEERENALDAEIAVLRDQVDRAHAERRRRETNGPRSLPISPFVLLLLHGVAVAGGFTFVAWRRPMPPQAVVASS